MIKNYSSQNPLYGQMGPHENPEGDMGASPRIHFDRCITVVVSLWRYENWQHFKRELWLSGKVGNVVIWLFLEQLPNIGQLSLVEEFTKLYIINGASTMGTSFWAFNITLST